MRMLKRTVWRIPAFIVFLLLVATLLAYRFFPYFIKNKLCGLVKDKTDFILQIGAISWDGWNGMILEEVLLIPKNDKETYEKNGEYESDWVRIGIRKISFHGIQWRSFISQKKLEIKHALFVKPELRAYRDKRKPNGPFKFQALPSRLLREVDFQVTIPWIEIREGEIKYEEIPEKGSPTLRARFTELNGVVHHLSSDAIYYHAHPNVHVEATGKVFGSIPAHIRYVAETRNEKDAFTLEGSLHSFDATVFNQYLVPEASLEIKEGVIDSVWFKWDANNEVAQGDLHLLYHGLKIKANHQNKPKKFVALKSLLSKLFVKRENLPNEKENTGEVHFHRIKNRSIFNYVWNAFKTGFASAILRLPDKTVVEAIEKKAHHAKK